MIRLSIEKNNRTPARNTAILEEEKKNVQKTIPLVVADSSLGWEPTLEYACDREHLEWKIAKLDSVLNYTIPNYRLTVKKY